MSTGRSINELDAVVSTKSFSDVTTDLTALSVNELDTVIIANRSPDETTDLATLCGQQNKYQKMAETLFRSEFGNVKLGDILLTPKDEFLKEYGKSPQTRSLLRGWIEEYNLSHRFAKRDSGKVLRFVLSFLSHAILQTKMVTFVQSIGGPKSVFVVCPLSIRHTYVV